MHNYNTQPIIFTWQDKKPILYGASIICGILAPIITFSPLDNENSIPNSAIALMGLTCLMGIAPILNKHIEHYCCVHNRDREDSRTLSTVRSILLMALGASTLINSVGYGLSGSISPKVSISLGVLSALVGTLGVEKWVDNRKKGRLESIERSILEV